ncbi:MAG: toxin-antitoxin system HicB family antitoxin [Desulfovibrionales bacterium]|nr:toxin-antitoxin system HicB family antitoxin [Desulfovibrionales bacterium]
MRSAFTIWQADPCQKDRKTARWLLFPDWAVFTIGINGWTLHKNRKWTMREEHEKYEDRPIFLQSFLACKYSELGQKPNKPYSGNLMLRIPAEIHAAVACAAESSGNSINQWAARVLDKASHAH